jgi:RNA-directed DNA polymerase
MGKVKTSCRRMDTNQPLDVLLLQLNRMLRGWCAHFRPGVSSATFAYLSAYTWARVIGWLRRKHRRITVKELRRRYCAGGWWPGTTERTAVQPGEGAHHALPIPGRSDPRSVAGHGMRTTRAMTGLVERPLLGNGHGGCGRRLGETHRWKHRQGAPGRPHYYLLEDAGFEVMLVNPRQVKNLPGRKSDVSDAAWLAQLGGHGLVRGSFVPPAPIRQLRDLTRAAP